MHNGVELCTEFPETRMQVNLQFPLFIQKFNTMTFDETYYNDILQSYRDLATWKVP